MYFFFFTGFNLFPVIYDPCFDVRNASIWLQHRRYKCSKSGKKNFNIFTLVPIPNNLCGIKFEYLFIRNCKKFTSRALNFM